MGAPHKLRPSPRPREQMRRTETRGRLETGGPGDPKDFSKPRGFTPEIKDQREPPALPGCPSIEPGPVCSPCSHLQAPHCPRGDARGIRPHAAPPTRAPEPLRSPHSAVLGHPPPRPSSPSPGTQGRALPITPWAAFGDPHSELSQPPPHSVLVPVTLGCTCPGTSDVVSSSGAQHPQGLALREERGRAAKRLYPTHKHFGVGTPLRQSLSQCSNPSITWTSKNKIAVGSKVVGPPLEEGRSLSTSMQAKLHGNSHRNSAVGLALIYFPGCPSPAPAGSQEPAGGRGGSPGDHRQRRCLLSWAYGSMNYASGNLPEAVS